ncbi:gustatory receptor for sugar taste 64f-like isoform X1 [Acyrthosiphon pisum]|uniref:Gustatory receptor n=1 Tax=Acyrthosiphon pisum TaxID=7029 RepID=A0A8R2B8S9_ACYPI|nr:gustatory receptor for sugar taste 64f-like isoform X1 [Acyrthosiphon pisum]|eukprot:XP_008186707.1 PREDICTED: gustatory receptor for sugar taste 64f-like isoform X1 [Acyrthosiphon pisum]
MSDENTFQPVYLKDRNFTESGYERQLKQSSLANVAVRSNYNALSLKENKGNIALEIQDDLGMPVNYVRIKALEDSIRKDIISDKNSLHRAITPLLILVQICALLPVQGIRGQNTSYLVFNWFSWIMSYSIILVCSSLLMILLIVFNLYRNGLTYEITGDLVFYGGTLINYMVFIHLAREWPKVMEKWELMEREMKQYGYPPNMAFKIKMLTCIIMLLSIIEHLASILTGVLKAIHCSPDGLDIFRLYILTSLETVFTFIDYSFVVAIILKFFNCLYSFAWNFMDLLIIVLACALTDKFKQLNQKLDSVRGKVLPSMYWRKSRETYNVLASLTHDFDEFLSPLILLSFGHNLYFICLQLLNSLKPMHSSWEALCFAFLFTYLVGRTCVVSLYVASINDQSKKPKTVLFSVPAECYGVEVERFLMQVTADELSFTGCNFFSVTRTFMLTVAGTIVTYEIVLIQFNNVASEIPDQNNTFANYCPKLL